MKVKRIRAGTLVALATAALAIACGDGRVILDVDVLSFIKGATQSDTIHYSSPPLPPASTACLPPIGVSLPGALAKSTVQSVTITATLAAENNTGTGDVTVKLHFSSDSATTCASAITTGGTVNVSGPQTKQFTLSPLPPASDTLWNKSKLFVGVRTGINATAVPFDGRVHLVGLRSLIVINDRIF
jgi:hypothetical protein